MPIISGLVKPGDQALISISPILKCSAMMILILSKDLYSFVKKRFWNDTHSKVFSFEHLFSSFDPDISKND